VQVVLEGVHCEKHRERDQAKHEMVEEAKIALDSWKRNWALPLQKAKTHAYTVQAKFPVRLPPVKHSIDHLLGLVGWGRNCSHCSCSNCSEMLFMEESLLAAYWRVTQIPKDGVLDVFWEDILNIYIISICSLMYIKGQYRAIQNT